MEVIYTEIRIALYAIWRMRWLALAVAWGFCLVGWVMVMRVPAAYESSARVSVQVKSLLGDGSEGDMQKGIDRVRQSLTSTEILKKVVRSVSNGERPLTSFEALSLIGALRSGISITAQGEDLIEIKTRISLKGISEQQTAFITRNVTQQLIEIFVSENLDQRPRQQRGSRAISRCRAFPPWQGTGRGRSPPCDDLPADDGIAARRGLARAASRFGAQRGHDPRNGPDAGT